MYRLKFGFVLMAIMAVLCGCEIFNFAGKVSATSTGELPGTQWTLDARQIAGEKKNDAPAGEVYTISFDTDTTVSVRAHCNECGGPYTVSEENRLSFEYLICTRAVCGWSTNFIEALRRTQFFELEADELRLYYNIASTEGADQEQAILYFRRGIQE